MIQHRVNPIPGTLEPVHLRLLTAVIGMMAGLTGCVNHVWCNPNSSSEQALTQVQYACKSGNAQSHPDTRPDISVNTDPHALRAVSGAPVNSSGVDPFEFKACMEKRGYQYVTQKQCDAMVPTRAPERCSLGATCVDEAPPPLKEEVIGTSPTPGYIWMSGYYVYYGKAGYQWTDGHWGPARPGYHWNAPHWEQIGSKWIFTPGDWERDN
jgi:hypothetical protein